MNTCDVEGTLPRIGGIIHCYRLGRERLRELSAFSGLTVTYNHGRFNVEKAP